MDSKNEKKDKNMKKLGKILTLVLSLALVVTALVVIGAANDTGTVSEKNWVVEGVTGDDGLGGFDSLVDAITAAGGTKAVKLNRDITISDNLSITENAIVDLGGHTITETRTDSSACVFPVSGGGTSFTLQGAGSIVDCSQLILVTSDAANATIKLSGTGDGISVTMNSSTATNNFSLITLEDRCSTMTVTGKVTVTPSKYFHANYSCYLFSVGKKSTTENSALTFDGATITLNYASDTSNAASNYKAAWFIKALDGATVTIKNNSFINLIHGNAFDTSSATGISASVTYTTEEDEENGYGKGHVTGFVDSTKAFNPQTVDKVVTINIEDSTVYAFQSNDATKWNSTTADGGNGLLFSVGASKVAVVAKNSTLGGACRTICANNACYYKGSAGTNGNVNGNVFNFTNVNYVYDTTSKYTSSWVISGGVNMTWNGGIINSHSALAGDSFEYSKLTVGDEDACFGVLYANVYVVGRIGSNSTYLDGNSYNRCNAWSHLGTQYTGVTVITDSDVLTANYAFLDEAPRDLGLVAGYTSTFNEAEGYYFAQSGTLTDENGKTVGTSEESATATKRFGTPVEIDGNKGTKYGRYSEIKDENGNGYIKLDFYKGAYNGGTALFDAGDVYTGLSYGNFYGTPKMYVKDYAYLVHEFDLATDSGKFYYLKGNVMMRPNGGGYYYYKNDTLMLDTRAFNHGILNLQNDGDLFGDDRVILPNDGSWTRISIVYEIKQSTTSIGDTNYVSYEGSKAHVYVDGVFAKSVELFKNKYFTETQNNSFIYDSLRFQMYGITEDSGSTCIDNNRLSAYRTATDALTAISANASSVKLTSYKSDFLVMPKASNIEMATANVSWVIGDKTVGTSTPLAGSTVSDVAPEAIVLKQANELRNELNNGWYDYGFSGWKVTDAEDNELTSTDTLAENATYTFTAVCDKLIAPEKGVSGMKINLSLRLDFDLNFYVPVPDSKLNVSNVMISKGTTKLDSGTIDQSGNTYVYGQEVTVYGDLYTKHRDIYGVAELGTRTYTLSYTVGTTVITQDITYGVSDYVGQYMSTSKDDGNTVPRTLVMQMVNYAVKVVEHEDSGVTKTGVINEVITKYEALLTKYPELLTTTEKSYFTTDASVLAKIESSKKSVFGTDADGNVNTTAPDNKVAYYLESPALYFSTGTPKFIFKYTDAALAQGIKNPNGNEMTDYGAKPGIFAYTGYNSKATQGKHLAYAGGIGSGTKQSNSDAVWGDNTKTDGSVTYYVTMLDDTFRGNSFAVYELLRNIQIDVNLTCYDSDASQYKTTGKASGKYCLEWYINGIIEGGAVDADVELAIALYDYAKVAYEYVMGTAYVPTTV